MPVRVSNYGAGGNQNQNAAAAKQTVAAQEAAAARDADQMVGGMSVEQMRGALPEQFQPMITNVNGVQRLLGMGGMNKNDQKRVLNSENGGEEILGFLNREEVQKKIIDRINKQTQRGAARAAADDPQAAQRQSPRPAPAGPAPQAQAPQQAAAAASPPSSPPDGPPADPPKPREYPDPRGPNVETTGSWIDSVAGRFMAGQADASKIVRMEHAQDPDGKIKSIYEFSDGSKVLASNGQPVSVSPPASAQGGSAEASSGNPRTEQATPAEPKQLPPFWEQVETNRQKYRDRRVEPPFTVPLTTAMGRNWPNIVAGTIGTGVAAGLGYGISRGLSGNATGQPPQRPDELLQSLDAAFPMGLPQPAASGTSQPRPQPQPQPQPNPAGTAPSLNTTLLNRLMQSREYA